MTLALLAAIAVVALRSNTSLTEDMGWVVHTHEVITDIEELRGVLHGAESAQRGILLGAPPALRERYAEAVARWPALWTALRALTDDQEPQTARLDAMRPLIEHRMALLERGLALATDPEALRALIGSGESTRTMARIDDLIDQLRAHEEDLLRSRHGRAARTERATRVVIAVAIVLATVAAAFGALALRGWIGAQRRLEVGLRRARDELEAQVAQRTADLERTNAELRTTLSRERDGRERLRASEERFRLLVDGVHDHAIHLLDDLGRVVLWNTGAQRITGFTAEDLVGQDGARLYLDDEIAAGLPARLLAEARSGGECATTGRVRRRDGSWFWADIAITALRDPAGAPAGFAQVTHDITARRAAAEAAARHAEQLERTVAARTAELRAANAELEAFSYSVSHDLRAPLRAMAGFAQALVEDCGGRLDEACTDHLRRIRAATLRMGVLIDALLELSRLSRIELAHRPVDLSALAREVVADLQAAEPQRAVTCVIADGLAAEGDPGLLRVLLTNLLGNAWKFTARTADARIAFAREDTADGPAFVVRDNGAGFDAAYADKLFGAFQRLHSERDFPGTGIGLATVRRIVARHGGRVWAEGAPGRGAAFFFTLRAA